MSEIIIIGFLSFVAKPCIIAIPGEVFCRKVQDLNSSKPRLSSMFSYVKLDSINEVFSMIESVVIGIFLMNIAVHPRLQLAFENVES